MGDVATAGFDRRRCACGTPVDGATCSGCGWPVDSRKPHRLILPLTLVPLAALLLGVASIAIPYAVMPMNPAVAGAGEVLPPSAPQPDVDHPAELLVTDVSGMQEFEPYPEHADGLTLDEAAALDEETAPQQRERLEELAFVEGAIRWWLIPEERVLYVSVLEFSEDSAAPEYVSDAALGAASDATVVPIAVPAPGAVAYGYDVAGDNSYGYEVLFSKGRRAYRVVMVNLDGEPGHEDLLSDVVAEQYTNG